MLGLQIAWILCWQDTKSIKNQEVLRQLEVSFYRIEEFTYKRDGREIAYRIMFNLGDGSPRAGFEPAFDEEQLPRLDKVVLLRKDAPALVIVYKRGFKDNFDWWNYRGISYVVVDKTGAFKSNFMNMNDYYKKLQKSKQKEAKQKNSGDMDLSAKNVRIPSHYPRRYSKRKIPSRMG